MIAGLLARKKHVVVCFSDFIALFGAFRTFQLQANSSLPLDFRAFHLNSLDARFVFSGLCCIITRIKHQTFHDILQSLGEYLLERLEKA